MFAGECVGCDGCDEEEEEVARPPELGVYLDTYFAAWSTNLYDFRLRQ